MPELLSLALHKVENDFFAVKFIFLVDVLDEGLNVCFRFGFH